MPIAFAEADANLALRRPGAEELQASALLEDVVRPSHGEQVGRLGSEGSVLEVVARAGGEAPLLDRVREGERIDRELRAKERGPVHDVRVQTGVRCRRKRFEGLVPAWRRRAAAELGAGHELAGALGEHRIQLELDRCEAGQVHRHLHRLAVLAVQRQEGAHVVLEEAEVHEVGSLVGSAAGEGDAEVLEEVGAGLRAGRHPEGRPVGGVGRDLEGERSRGAQGRQGQPSPGFASVSAPPDTSESWIEPQTLM